MTRTNMTRTNMTRDILKDVGATTVCFIRNGETVGYVDNEVLAQPGFYFVVKGAMGYRQVAARFAIGRQRSGHGFRGVLSNIRSDRSQANRTMHYNGVLYEVLYLPIEKMKPLTTGFGKGQLALAFTRRHNEEYQNITEMNLMLGDNFNFILQS
ncbi:Ndd-like nucleoid disruption protein [Escherichia phage EcS1]|uniref:Nucleoid disruption protein n=1 Tax=Escherichia phage EcS1 TaxID=2083276 RepID=A0A2Z5ZCE5_9CAUD|nr:Ndd-like nucleoid disruption protein [Escherichia phage EcS1]BBC78338.1 Nucleoid disruption protein [Escherichia phage EcS1]